MHVVVGLGNPGLLYKRSRHNAGFQALDVLADYLHFNVTKRGFSGVYGEGLYRGERLVLVKPTTYMNLSGDCVQSILHFYKCPVENLIVLYDDIDLPVGKIRIRRNGGTGTHNGMRSILDALQHTDFPRVRIGIGPKPERWDLADYVLSHVAPEMEETWRESLVRAADAVDTIVKESLDAAISRCQV